MARRRHDGVELPEEIIQHIQSLLKNKESAQTSVLSKSWYKAWCTRPTLLLYGYDFTTGFFQFASKTIRRCVDLNVKVNKLVLDMPFSYDAHLVHNLFNDILKLRVNVFEFDFRIWDKHEFLPAQVFANECLTELCLNRCKVGDLVSRSAKLRSLSLNHVSTEDNVFEDILVGSPVIERLVLAGSSTKGLTRINACQLYNLESLIIDNVAQLPVITPSVMCGQFVNLSCLVLRNVSVDDSFYANLSSSFPKLEDLTLDGLNYDVNIQISSNSIKRVSVGYYYRTLEMASFDVPNIREFKFSGDHVPSLSFIASSEDWKSEIKLSNHDGIDLSKLRDLLMKLGQSKISLHLHVGGKGRNVAPPITVENVCLPALEELRYYVIQAPISDFFMECVFSCRPKLVSLFCNYGKLTIQNLYRKFIKQRNQNSFNTSPGDSSSLCITDLKEVSVEVLEDSLKQWQPLQSSADALDIGEIWKHREERLRLKLIWGSLPTEQTIIKFIEHHTSKD